MCARSSSHATVNTGIYLNLGANTNIKYTNKFKQTHRAK